MAAETHRRLIGSVPGGSQETDKDKHLVTELLEVGSQESGWRRAGLLSNSVKPA